MREFNVNKDDIEKLDNLISLMEKDLEKAKTSSNKSEELKGSEFFGFDNGYDFYHPDGDDYYHHHGDDYYHHHGDDCYSPHGHGHYHHYNHTHPHHCHDGCDPCVDSCADSCADPCDDGCNGYGGHCFCNGSNNNTQELGVS